MTVALPTPARSGGVARWLLGSGAGGGLAALVAGAVALSWVAALAWWWLLPESQTVDLTIPAGTAAAVASGHVPPELPETLVLRVGDRLTVRNLDEVVHRLGPLWIAPGARERTEVTAAFLGSTALVCSIHPAGALGVAPRSRPSVAVTVPVALLAAVPLSVAGVFAAAVARRLD